MATSIERAPASLIMDTSPRYRYRKSVDRAVRVFMVLSLAISVTLLVIIIGYVMYRGASYINWEFLTTMPKPLGQEGGGIANAIVGSLIIVSLATALAVPIAVGAAIFLSEFSSTLLGRPVRFVADVLTGVPSIVVGIFAYTMLVAPFGSFSGLAGAGALAFIMIPIVLIGAQEALRLVPNSLREGALALGLARWRTIFRVVLPAARRALLTALVLAIARVLGETAPLLITALGNRFWTTDPSSAMAAIPLVIYRYATGPYEQWHQQAWAGAFILLCVVLLSSVLTRFVLRSRYDR
jgi:phosphate transport system permease protein